MGENNIGREYNNGRKTALAGSIIMGEKQHWQGV